MNRLRKLKALRNGLKEVFLSGYVPRDLTILKSEFLVQRAQNRRFMLDLIPSDSVGAEIGVFTGLFSSILARDRRISKVTFVDPWWKAFGSHYPDWGISTDNGRLSTQSAYEVARIRVSRCGLPNRFVEVAFSYDWLAAQPDRSLDWAYLDSTHDYEGTSRELELLDRKISDTGIILGDDWILDPDDINHGVFLAVSEFVKSSNFELILCGQHRQWAIRRVPLNRTPPKPSSFTLIAESAWRRQMHFKPEGPQPATQP
jgi:Methyltransferase domain